MSMETDSKMLETPHEYRKKYISEKTGQGHFALIILNQPILIQRHLFENVWNNATYRICADAGANRLYDLLGTDAEREKYLPDYVRGDLDSLRDSVKEYYQSKHVPIERVEDDVSTDFMKCIHLVRACDSRPWTEGLLTQVGQELEQQQLEVQHEQQASSGSKLEIVVLGGTGGRFDQSMSSLHHLYVLYQERQATLISDESIIVVLGKGKHSITCNLAIEGPTCGIIPLGSIGSSEAKLTTTGLKWDVENWRTSFGSQMSTSNSLVGPHVTIEIDAPMVWTTELRSSPAPIHKSKTTIL